MSEFFLVAALVFVLEVGLSVFCGECLHEKVWDPTSSKHEITVVHFLDLSE